MPWNLSGAAGTSATATVSSPAMRNGARRVTVVSLPCTVTSKPYSPGGNPARSTIARVTPPPPWNGTRCAGVVTTRETARRARHPATARNGHPRPRRRPDGQSAPPRPPHAHARRLGRLPPLASIPLEVVAELCLARREERPHGGFDNRAALVQLPGSQRRIRPARYPHARREQQ